MDERHSTRTRTGTNFGPSRICDLLFGPVSIQKSTSIKRFVLKALPFAVITTTLLLGIGDSAFAATINAPVDLLTHPHSINPLNPFMPIMDLFNTMKQFFTDLPTNIGKLTIVLMSGLYKLCAALILKTPIWIFDNPWFKDTTFLFSIAAISLTTVLSLLEALKKMLSGLKPKRGKALFKFLDSKPMDMKDIGKRWSIVAVAMMGVPWMFQQAFKGLNWVSDRLIGMNIDLMDAHKLADHIDWFDVVTMGVFDIVLISTVIPTLWKNGRRFFDLMMLGLTAPLAMTAWIFDSHRHYFDQWWGNLKHLSMVQVYHALFLLVLGWFIFGIPTPTDFIGMVVKLLIVIGGFARMTDPPRVVANHLADREFVGIDRPQSIASKVGANFRKSRMKIDGIERIVGKKFMTTPTGWVMKKASKLIKLVPPRMRKGN